MEQESRSKVRTFELLIYQTYIHKPRVTYIVKLEYLPMGKGRIGRGINLARVVS